ncbi:hypothetical protein AA23498_1186 [Acetobacter nitrogenifigens DSM 23921 = NBRC 105050]|uniref:Uncharacterized protein n=1 Tax=Acetobacter nitrogenifigens DSM 23921 = NBRC 105050 TaxID=1120919 RepID=A0A511XDA7_9PROT|nr:hypothetical protein [Acetobacter nitrogenifigens]GBQ91464.1 hypothetical protein AA23498_1186 [Acetobacter nitrogenifigens DSM 23921 = NBRC 105050]GEN60865.1 hypothetical protein ANI02nite_27490 [Acetobacter nitrogenifigens DSM 23921 = NBRC 105050]
MNYFFQGWIGLLLENGNEVTTPGYARIPTTFQALGGGNETRADTQPVFNTATATLPVCARLGLFSSVSGLDPAAISWPIACWSPVGIGASYVVSADDAHLILDRSTPWQNGAQIGVTAAGQPVYVAPNTTLIAGTAV